jgi:hypothetical protein
MDVVEYTGLSMNEQRRVVDELQSMVLGCLAEAQGDDALRLPTGDGAALVFFDDPQKAALCAEAIAREATDRGIRLRMGLHSGPVHRVTDINQHESVSGAGINIAQRVMAVGDAGHILFSSAIASVLCQSEEWTRVLFDLGEHQIRAGAPLRLYNLVRGQIGNANLPRKLRSGVTLGAHTAPRVVVLYRRGVRPDDRLVTLLETQLGVRGHAVFIDRHLAVGVDWARQIEQEIRCADFVIPLLSRESIASEMLAYEVRVAREAGEGAGGRPQLLPVRVAYTGPLPEELAVVLGPLKYALWDTENDDRRLLTELLAAMQGPDASAGDPYRATLSPPTGVLPLDSRFYITRPADDELTAAAARRDSIVRVTGARQMGKTSLLARTLQEMRRSDRRVVCTDLQTLNSSDLVSPEQLLKTLARRLAEALDLSQGPEAAWDPLNGPSWNFRGFMLNRVLGLKGRPVVWAIDELDRLFGLQFSDEIFGLFRSWHNERALDPSLPWGDLTLVLSYASEAHLLIADLNQSPFNVGTRIQLHDFTLEQTADLNGRYGCPLRSEEEVAAFVELVGGQPFLVNRGLHEMVAHDLSFAALAREAHRDEGVFGDHLRRVLALVACDQASLSAVLQLLKGGPIPNTDLFYRLRSAGVLSGETAQRAGFRCGLYGNYLTQHLLH